LLPGHRPVDRLLSREGNSEKGGGKSPRSTTIYEEYILPWWRKKRRGGAELRGEERVHFDQRKKGKRKKRPFTSVAIISPIPEKNPVRRDEREAEVAVEEAKKSAAHVSWEKR